MKIVFTAFCVLAFFAGCADKVKVTLLPEDGDKVGTIRMDDKDGKSHTINKAWGLMEIKKDGTITTDMTDEKTVLRNFGDTIKALPKPPLSFTVFFNAESADIDYGLSKELSKAVEAIKREKSTLVVCAGHTDSMGEKSYNKILSLKRAEVVSKYLIKHGVNAKIIELHYYGEANLLIKTAQGVPEPRNRRVEIIVK